MLYGTTADFLRCFGLDSLDALPKTTEEIAEVFAKTKVDTDLIKLDEVSNGEQMGILDYEEADSTEDATATEADAEIAVPAEIVEEIAEERSDIKVGKINVDEQPELANEFGVMSIPTLVVMENGRIINQARGARPKKAILDLL